MTSLFIFSSCEDNTDQVLKTQPDTTKEITNRDIRDCDDCPEEYCCCAIEGLQNNPELVVVFCGILPMTAGTVCGPITPPSPCSTISGTSSILTIPANGGRVLFCVPDGGSFSLQRISANPGSAKITCKAGQFNPPYSQFNLGTDPFYFDTENCNLGPCE